MAADDRSTGRRHGFKVTHTLLATAVLAIHIVVAAFLFCVIAAAAVGLNQVTDWCAARGMPRLVVYGMQGVEALLWVADVWCMVWLVLVEVFRFTAAVWDGRKER